MKAATLFSGHNAYRILPGRDQFGTCASTKSDTALALLLGSGKSLDGPGNARRR
jgi:hypothetical protein